MNSKHLSLFILLAVLSTVRLPYSQSLTLCIVYSPEKELVHFVQPSVPIIQGKGLAFKRNPINSLKNIEMTVSKEVLNTEFCVLLLASFSFHSESYTILDIERHILPIHLFSFDTPASPDSCWFQFLHKSV